MELINKFATMKGMMLQLGASSGLLGKIPGLKQLSQMKQLAGMDVEKLMEVADHRAKGRVVSLLEGGYDLEGLSKSVAAHVIALMRG